MTLAEKLRDAANGLDAGLSNSAAYLRDLLRAAADVLDARQAPAEPPADVQETIAGLEKLRAIEDICGGTSNLDIFDRALSLLRQRRDEEATPPPADTAACDCAANDLRSIVTEGLLAKIVIAYDAWQSGAPRAIFTAELDKARAALAAGALSQEPEPK